MRLFEQPNKDLLSKKLKYSIHCITYTYMLKRKKWKTVCFEGYSKAVTFHTHELYDSHLACQHFISNSISFVSLSKLIFILH